MRRKILLLLVIAATAMMMTGCVNDANTDTKSLEEDTNTNVSDVNVGQSYTYEIKLTEKNHNQLVREQPPEMMDGSLERQNLIRRYQYLNDEDNVHHVYLMSNDGKVVAYFVAQGKVSSVNSKLTNNKQIVSKEECVDDVHYDGLGACYKTVESPQLDGSYGTNGDAIFFFTTDGQYVESNNKYVVSEKPLNIQTAVSLEHEVQYDGGDASTSTNAP